MAARKPKVIVTRKLPDTVETRMRELFDTELNLTDRPLSREELEAAVARADVLAPTITDEIDAALLEKAGPQLKLIANFGAGVDHIDVTAATERGVTVTNTPGVLTEDTADLTMALIMAVARRLVEGANVVQSGDFRADTLEGPGVETVGERERYEGGFRAGQRNGYGQVTSDGKTVSGRWEAGKLVESVPPQPR